MNWRTLARWLDVSSLIPDTARNRIFNTRTFGLLSSPVAMQAQKHHVPYLGLAKEWLRIYCFKFYDDLSWYGQKAQRSGLDLLL